MPAQKVILDEKGIEILASRIASLAKTRANQRVVIGVGGIAGSGKSTLADRLAERIGGAVALGLDGFHLTNAKLQELNRYERKGAPDTYDVAGFIALLRKYRDADAHGPYPIYDRANTHEPIVAPDEIDASVRVIIAEGQFMLLDQPPWDELAGVFDEGWFVDTPIATAKAWILARHTATGRTPQQAAAKYENDLRNSRLVLQLRRKADLVLRWKHAV